MKFNISYPVTGGQKCIEIDDDKKCNVFMDKRIGQEVQADSLGDEFKGYVFKIAGGNDKQGFPMKQGVFAKGRVRLLLSAGHSCFTERRSGFKKRKSVRGCIVGPDMRVLALQVVKKGEKEIEGVTDVNLPRKLGPKRANKIKKLFGLKKEDDQILVKKSVIRRTFKSGTGKERVKCTKIQRLITPERLRRKRVYLLEKKSRSQKTKAAREEYEKFLVEWRKQRNTTAQKVIEEPKKTVPVAADNKNNKNAPVQKQPVVNKKQQPLAKNTTAVQQTAAQKKTAPVPAKASAATTQKAPVQKAPVAEKKAPVAEKKAPVAEKKAPVPTEKKTGKK